MVFTSYDEIPTEWRVHNFGFALKKSVNSIVEMRGKTVFSIGRCIMNALRQINMEKSELE